MKVDPRSLKGLSRFLAPSAGGPVADRAVVENLVTAAQLQECIDEQDRSGQPLDEILVHRGYLKAADLERLRAPAVPAEVVPWISDPTRVLGHYVLVSVLGTGGMSEVWKSWDRSLGRWVAVKTLKVEVGHPTQRIEREGRMAGQLSHPSIITIYEKGTHGGRPYLVMPYVDGNPPKPPLPAREAARLGMEVARALNHVHGAGVIHRDVKPANILVEAGGRIVLADFGLAILDESATSRWAMSGTPEYASPEQIRGDALDVRTDIYSLGATLYHLLAGRPPFSGTGVEEITAKVLNEEPAPIHGIPRRLAEIVRKAMARDRDRRYGEVAQMAQDLEAWIDTTRARPRLKVAWIVIAALAAILPWGATLLVLVHSQRQEDRKRVLELLRDGDRKLDQAERRRLTAAGGVASNLDIRDAMTDFTTALRWAGGSDPEAQFGIGRCYEMLGDDRRAEDAYTEAGDLPAARSALGWLWARRLLEGRTDKDWKAQLIQRLEPRHMARLYAEGKWEAVVSSRPADRDAGIVLLLQGAAAVQLQHWDEALKNLEEALRSAPGDSTGLYYKGLALAGKGETAGAAGAWGEALRLAPENWGLRPEARRRYGEIERK